MTDKYQGCMPDSLFKKLSVEKEREFRQWARDNWAPDTPAKFSLYHPVIRDEWRVIDEGVLLPPVCDPCSRFFARFRCSAATHGECDCPRCQGYCKCEVK